MGQKKRDRTLAWQRAKLYTDIMAECKEILQKPSIDTKANAEGEVDGKKA